MARLDSPPRAHRPEPGHGRAEPQDRTAASGTAGLISFLIDEMFPAAGAGMLREKYGHDAIHVAEAGLRGAPDTQVAASAQADGRAAENVADFSAERDVALVFVLKPNLPMGSAQAPALAALLDRWAHDSPDPYLGPHWPRVD